MIEIKSIAGVAMYRSETAITICEAMVEAVQSRADLSGADLTGARLSGADLTGADLTGARLSRADLTRACLTGADLSGSRLSGADLTGARLSGSRLSGADLSGADLTGADLSRADLTEADLTRADLTGADLTRACLTEACLTEACLTRARLSDLHAARLSITPETGAFDGWKKCRDNMIVHLRIPAAARRSNATGRKCRAEFVETLAVFGGAEARSIYDPAVFYRVGEITRCHDWSESRWVECGGGIHFFLTRAEAEAHC